MPAAPKSTPARSGRHAVAQPPRVAAESEAPRLTRPATAGLVAGAVVNRWRRGEALDPMSALRASSDQAPVVAGIADWLGVRGGVAGDDDRSWTWLAFVAALLMRLAAARISRVPGFRPRPAPHPPRPDTPE